MTSIPYVLPKRRLGRSGPEVGAIALGSWHIFDRLTFEAGAELLAQAIACGVNLFDVGVYGEYPPLPDGSLRKPSWTDVLFGQMMRAAGVRRDQYLLSEKLWLWTYPQRDLTSQLDAALRRVGSDYADIGIVGEMRRPEIDIVQVTREVGSLLRSGRLRHWGVNNWSAAQILRAHQVAEEAGFDGPVLVQQKYSVSRRSVVEGNPYQELVRRTGISVEASDVLESGYLAGRDNVERQLATDTGGIRERIIADMPRFRDAAASLDATPAQAAIAFCLAHPHVATALVGCSSLEQLRDNVEACRLLDRSPQLRARLEDFWLDREVVHPEASWNVEPA